jgi:hypothetical protein
MDRKYLCPSSLLFLLPKEGEEEYKEPVERTEWDIVKLPPDYAHRIKVYQVISNVAISETLLTAPSSSCGNKTWDDHIRKLATRSEALPTVTKKSFDLCFDVWGVRLDLVSQAERKLYDHLRQLDGMYAVATCAGECFGVYNTVIGQWLGPPHDRRIAAHLGVPFVADISKDMKHLPDKEYLENLGRQFPVLMRRSGDVACLVS